MPGPAATEQVLVPPLRQDLLTDATRRLVLIAMLVAFVASVGLVFSLVELSAGRGEPQTWVRMGAAIWMLSLAGLAAIGLRGRRLTPRQMRMVGTAFLMVLAVSSGLVRHLVAQGDSLAGTVPGIAVAVMLFPVLVPGTPRRAAFNGLAATAVDVAAYAALATAGLVPAADLWQMVATFRADLVATAVAYGIAHVVSSLEERVVEARRMGAYTLNRRLGAGAMGEVWTASHSHLARPAAVKLIRTDRVDDPFAREGMEKRFEREVQATAALRCPHTIEIYDFGVTADGSLYYVMELLEGSDLQRLVDGEGRQPVARVVHMCRQICASLAEAHEAGLVHRDIKPANIFVCTYGRERDFVKVLDFGLVKVAAPEQAGLTMVGAITGTPAYMAPEQTVDGRAVDGRADVYALGLLAHFMLTGRLIFGDLAPAAYLAAQRNRTPPRLEDAGVEVPSALQDLIGECLAKGRDDRPPTMDAVAERLEAIAAELPRWPPRAT
ncbi:MAG: serine/threonine protein kinase [Nannocystaceae bacterium]|nr:serine/threonine protein kinase [Nannocystaceae bacterium]